MARYSIDNGRLTQIVSEGESPDSCDDRRFGRHDPLTKGDFDHIAQTMGGFAVWRKIGYVAGKPATETEVVITYRKGKETESVAKPGDVIAINLDVNRQPIVNEQGQPDRYTILQEKFPALYEPTGDFLDIAGEQLRIYRPQNTVYAVFFENGFAICPPWGGSQTSPSGYLFFSPLTGEVYGCEQEVAEKTYTPAPELWPTLPAADWVALHVPRFTKIRCHYETYERFLRDVLQEACRKLAPLAIVDTRTKGVPSFANKILRKHALYVDPKDPLPPDPLLRITDLCGGRIITQTSDQLHAVCRFLEQTFDIDWKNSDDASQRLKPREFGYRSTHYIVSANSDRLQAAGFPIPVPDGIRGLKAEVQVRTLLEHAWADIGHDMTYKTEVRVPDRIHRHFAALAAVLEGADREFERLVHSLDAFKSNYGAHHSREQVESEIERLRIVLAWEPGNVDLAVQAAQLALAVGRHPTALEILAPYRDQPHPGVQRLRGETLCELHRDVPDSPEYREGQTCLEAACRDPDVTAETLCVYAESWELIDDAKALEIFHRAIEIDGTEPLTLARYLEFEVAHLSHSTVLLLAAPMIRDAVRRCEIEIEGRVNLPAAWSSLALFHLFVGKPFAALDALAQLIRLCETPAGSDAERHCAAGRMLQRLGKTLRRLHCIREKLAGFDWFERLLLLGLTVRVQDPDARAALRYCATWRGTPQQPHFAHDEPIVILSGGCSPAVQTHIDRFREPLLTACQGLSFTVVSGGTTQGMSGLAGDVAQQSGGAIKAFGYLPRSLPRGLHEDHRFAARFSSAGTGDFTPLEPLQAWTDLVVAGVEPQRVKVLSYCGGPIARSELLIGLVLGARVGLVEDPDLPKDRQFSDMAWRDHPGLLPLPFDRMTLRAFLLVNELPTKPSEFEQAAKAVHEEYLKSAKPPEPSLQPWESLPDDLKLSCWHQVAYSENILRTVGLGLRPLTEHRRKDPHYAPLKMAEILTEGEIRRLAEMEHGRWNVERLLLGWQYDETRDVLKKRSPYLVPWDALPPEIQKFDLDSRRRLAETLATAGLEVYLLEQPARLNGNETPN